MYIPPHSTRSGTNPISTSLPKNKHSPTSQSLVRQHHETRCPPLFRPSFKLKSLENSGRRMRRVEGGWTNINYVKTATRLLYSQLLKLLSATLIYYTNYSSYLATLLSAMLLSATLSEFKLLSRELLSIPSYSELP